MGLVKNFLFNYVPLAIVVTVHKNIYFIFTCVSSGTCWNKKYFNYVPLTWISLELLIWIQNIFPCKQWDLLNENSTMSHWKKSLFTFLFKLKIDSCKQWDLNPHSFTLLFPKNSLSTNFNMLTLLYTKNPLP